MILPFLFCVYIAGAQKQANIWYFGNRVGLNFNTSPPAILNDGNSNSQEASAVMSDKDGNLLFYTNGVNVVNRRHQLLKNGNYIWGSLSSTDNVVILPLPGDDSIYYLFAIRSAMEDEHIFSYSIIDMKGDNGLGEITSKNIVISSNSLEKLAAIRHCNKKDFWIVIRNWESDEYQSYLLTAAGLSATPVSSSTGMLVGGSPRNAIGTLKFSSIGNKLASLFAFDNDAVELMDFDNATGIISNPLVFYPNSVPHQGSYPGVYGAEFSPDGKLLYVSLNNSITDPSALYQFDITSGNATAILASKKIIAQTTPWFAGDLQLGPDNKIYMAMWNDTSLSTIDNPNIYGTGCGFNFNKIKLGTGNATPVQFGLPNFMQSYFDSTANPYDFYKGGDCFSLSVPFTLNRLGGIDSVKWDFGDGQQSTLMQPTNTYAGPGFYNVKLIVYKVDCSGLNDTITRRIWITQPTTFLGPDTSSCNALTLQIGVEESFNSNYLWSTGANTGKITISGFGDYWLEIEQGGCKIRDTIKISPQVKPVVSLGADTSICKYKPVVLATLALGYDSYLWNTGETTPTIFIDKAGVYAVTVTKNLCEASDTIQVLPGDCGVYIPSAFTPNNDGKNDFFGVVDNAFVQFFLLQVFNKWGQLVFSSSDISLKWDGTFKGKQQPGGGYVWRLSYVDKQGRKINDQGTVMLIR